MYVNQFIMLYTFFFRSAWYLLIRMQVHFPGSIEKLGWVPVFVCFVFSIFVQMHTSVGLLQFLKKNDNYAKLVHRRKEMSTIWLPGTLGSSSNLAGERRTLGTSRELIRLKDWPLQGLVRCPNQCPRRCSQLRHLLGWPLPLKAVDHHVVYFKYIQFHLSILPQ